MAFAGQIPNFVLINRHIPAISQQCIALDNYRGGYIATRHLTNRGHRQIGYLCSDQGIEDSVDRLAGHRRAMEEAGIAIDDRCIIASNPSEQGGIEGTYRLLNNNLPLTAIVVYNDVMAAGVLSALQENSIRCPQDISVIGFDDLIIARHLYPKLSTIRYPIGLMAEQATHLCLNVSDQQQTAAVGTILTPTFIERSSVWDRN